MLEATYLLRITNEGDERAFATQDVEDALRIAAQQAEIEVEIEVTAVN